MQYWNSLLTEKSWNTLLELRKKPFKFILIGGWAAYMWTKMHKSIDVDIALKDIKQLDFLKNSYELKKNDNLKKYEIKIDEIDIDIYVPYFSRLSIPVNELQLYTSKIENIEVVKPEALLILKQGAEIERKDSVKGTKDQIDIMALLCFADINFKEYFRILKKYKLDHYSKRLRQIINSFKEISYLSLNPREFKKKKAIILSSLSLQ